MEETMNLFRDVAALPPSVVFFLVWAGFLLGALVCAIITKNQERELLEAGAYWVNRFEMLRNAALEACTLKTMSQVRRRLQEAANAK